MRAFDKYFVSGTSLPLINTREVGIIILSYIAIFWGNIFQQSLFIHIPLSILYDFDNSKKRKATFLLIIPYEAVDILNVLFNIAVMYNFQHISRRSLTHASKRRLKFPLFSVLTPIFRPLNKKMILKAL